MPNLSNKPILTIYPATDKRLMPITISAQTRATCDGLRNRYTFERLATRTSETRGVTLSVARAIVRRYRLHIS